MEHTFINWKRNIIVFLASQTLSLFGSSIVGFAIIWHITLETSSGSMMTIAVLCTFLPQVLISLFAGVWADRYNRKLLIMASDSFIAISTLILAFLIMAGDQQIWLLFLFSAIRSLGAGIQMPAVSAILPQLVPAQHLMRVNGINSTITSIMTLISPAVGGFVLSVWGFTASLFCDVITAAIAVLIMALLPIAAHQRAVAAKTSSPLADLREGMAYAKNQVTIKFLLIFYAVFFFMVTPASFLTPIMVDRVFGSDVWRLTANEMAWSGGSLLGGLLVALWGGFKNRIHTMALSCLGFGIFFTLLGFAGNFVFYLLMMFLAGIFMPLFTTAETVLIQETVEEGMLGRMFALIQIIVSVTMPLGMLVFGPLADLLPVAWIIVFSGVFLAAMGTWMLLGRKAKKVAVGKS